MSQGNAPALRARMPLGFLLVAAALLLPLALNRGYFNHDELQWLALTDVDSWRGLPWVAWSGINAFQYRPLTFNLWLLLAHAVGYHPYAMHAALALMGFCNAFLLRAVAIRLGAPPRAAGIAALVFLLTPYAVYTHGWVATLADVLCLMFLLLAILWLCRPQSEAPAAPAATLCDTLPVVALTALALFSKESAVVFPLLLACAWPRRGRRLLAPVLASAAVVAIYLMLRLGTILFAPRTPGVYTWSMENIPIRLLDYTLFPFYGSEHEIFGLDTHTFIAVWLPALAAGLLVAAVASSGWRRVLVLATGWAACLGPVLILDSAANIYAYVASAFACGCLAVIYPQIKPWARLLLLLPVGLAILHGVRIGLWMHRIGSVQHHLYADIGRTLRITGAAEPMRIGALRPDEDFIVRRVLHAVPSWHRLSFAGRIEVVPYLDSKSRPNWLMKPSGRLMRATSLPGAWPQSAGVAP